MRSYLNDMGYLFVVLGVCLSALYATDHLYQWVLMIEGWF